MEELKSPNQKKRALKYQGINDSNHFSSRLFNKMDDYCEIVVERATAPEVISPVSV